MPQVHKQLLTMFVITYLGIDKHGKAIPEQSWPKGIRPNDEAYVLIHTDDCDCVGSNDAINKFIADAMHERWVIKITDADFMLGVKRTLIDNDDEFSVELTMTSYVDGMFKAFE